MPHCWKSHVTAHLRSQWLRFFLSGSVVFDSLFIVSPILFRGSVPGPCFVIQYLVSFLVFHHLYEEERTGCLL